MIYWKKFRFRKNSNSSRSAIGNRVSVKRGTKFNTQFFNSFAFLTFLKTVIVEVSMTGAMNMALRPDVKHNIFNR